MQVKDILIAAGGLGTRMYNLTQGKLSKLLLPIGSQRIIDLAIIEAIESGAENIYVIVKNKNSDVLKYLKSSKVSNRINFLFQPSPNGPEDAFYYAKDYIKSKYFGVIFPDTIIKSNQPALLQIIKYNSKLDTPVLGYITLLKKDFKYTGHVYDFESEKYKDEVQIKRILPKYNDYQLNTLKQGKIFCRYILPTSFFKYYESTREEYSERKDNAPTLKNMISKEKILAIPLKGTFFDTGLPEGYNRAKSILTRH
ncbi:MAG TPA: sugar phosphate nucleotidyltransferase [Candidatus Nanoarchaeia archaeon]|nr:sugar phosphate nucleotidyltransferase [Candidatus Nanoarchaeia archaeon]